MISAADRLGHAAPQPQERELLRAALLPPALASQAWRRWRAAHDVDTAADQAHEILAAVSASVPGDVLGDDAGRLKGLRRRTWASTRLTLASLQDALDVLGQEGVEPVVVKGARLTEDVYTQPGVRRMADADIVVGPNHFPGALSALQSHGWVAKGSWTHAADLARDDGRGVDLHRWVLFPRFCRVEEAGWYARTTSGTFMGRPVRRLDLADELVLAVVHGLFTTGHSSVRWPLDVAQIVSHMSDLQADMAGFWGRVSSSAAEVGVSPIVVDGLELCSEEFGLEVPPRTIEEMRRCPMDPWLGLQWWNRRAGRFPPMRARKYVDLERAAGRKPAATGYVISRWEALQQHGPRRVIKYRLRNVARSMRRVLV